MSDFALVHGAYHGAWCWDLVVDELTARGHRAVAMDLPCEDPNAGVEHYAATVVDAMTDLGDDAIVVGHSLGGLTIPAVAAARPVGRLVFVAAIVPAPGRHFMEVAAADPPADPAFRVAAVDHGDGTSRYQLEYVERFFTHDAPEHTEWVAARLRRQSWAVTNEVHPVREWPTVPSAYIVCRGDRVVRPDWQRRAARDVLGVEPIELDGGHEPMIGRAAELAAVLDQIAVQPPSTTSV
jgi:pimeloyl-ACP methyl ester carboxylesterase